MSSLNRRSRRLLAGLALAAACGGQPRTAAIAPAEWAPGEWDNYLKLTDTWGRPKTPAVGKTGMITGTTGALAIHAGLLTLKAGGSAADAAMTTALAQIALAAGSWVSYAGLMNLMYFDAASGKVSSMNAVFNTVKGETDPRTIPACTTASGRTALVPGFFAGVQAVHDRFGKLPFSALFGPAIKIAEQGVPASAALAQFIQTKRVVLSRLPATKRIFTKPDGSWYAVGDLFRQPELAATLRTVAAQGAGYIYRGDWARHLVNAVRQDGGKMTMEDLAAYRVQWGEPLRTTYRGYQVFATGAPNFGGAKTLEVLNLWELAHVSPETHYWDSPEALYWLIQATQLNYVLGPPGGGVGPPEAWVKRQFPGVDLSLASRAEKGTAQRFWALMQSPKWHELKERARVAQDSAAAAMRTSAGGGGHSDAIVVVDAAGNVAALTHSINTAIWGGTGINIDGISIPDAACFQQDLIGRVEPGSRLPDPTNPMILLRDGKFAFAGSSVGAGLHENTAEMLINLLDYGKTPQEALGAPQFGAPDFGTTYSQSLAEGDFAPAAVDAIKARGQPAELKPKAQLQALYGWWISIKRDPVTGQLLGGTPGPYNGLAEGH
ncbi:MAG: gamma-glutamyltransferase [Gemmatimonadota bacterium]